MPRRRVLGLPRRAARARFSSICMVAAVPIMGSWNTRPIYFARLYSGRAVTSTPSMRIFPVSTGKTPAMALSMVLLPAPLPPMTVTKSPSFMVRFRPFKATFWFTVPALKVLLIFFSSSIVIPPSSWEARWSSNREPPGTVPPPAPSAASGHWCSGRAAERSG